MKQVFRALQLAFVPLGGGSCGKQNQTIRPECELGLRCMYSSPSARFSALHTFQAFGNSEKPAGNNGLPGALAVE